MNYRTAAGTVRCGWCKLEWISDDLEGHDDPQCLMYLFTVEMAEPIIDE